MIKVYLSQTKGELAVDLGLKNRVVLVTGASSGIGRATAVAFAGEGARVAITYRSNEAGARETLDRIRSAGGEGFALPMDLEDHSGIDDVVAQVIGRWGRIDVLIGNAVRWANIWGRPLNQLDPGELTAILRGNLEGTFHLLRAVLPSMVQERWGRIVLISSGLAEHGVPPNGSPVYGSAKAGLHGLARNLAWELGPAGIFINVVSAGFTMTERNLANFPREMRDSVAAQTPTRRLSVPEDVAASVIFLGSAANRNTSGEILHEGQATA
jgi:NAD(P)-dependent dehydrogenase (short-subunit alcohol dehydrogenase family)